MIAIEVDDLFMTGHQVHLQQLELLKKRFVFGSLSLSKNAQRGRCSMVAAYGRWRMESFR